MTAARTLTDADLDAIADRVAEKLRPKPKTAKRSEAGTAVTLDRARAVRALDRLGYARNAKR